MLHVVCPHYFWNHKNTSEFQRTYFNPRLLKEDCRVIHRMAWVEKDLKDHLLFELSDVKHNFGGKKNRGKKHGPV